MLGRTVEGGRKGRSPQVKVKHGNEQSAMLHVLELKLFDDANHAHA